MGAYSHWLEIDLTKAKKMLFVTGQIAMDKDGNVVCENDIEWQTEYVFESIKNILAESNASLDDIVKVVIYVKNIKDFPYITKIRNKYLEKSKPVSTLVEISNTVKPKYCAIKTGIAPLMPSPIKVIAAAFLPPIRSTLVAPGLLEPSVRGSGSLKALQTKIALEIEPIR